MARVILAMLRHHGRDAECVVVDDSRGAEGRAATLQALQSLAQSCPGRLSYAGPVEKAAYAEALAHRSGVPVEVVYFALGVGEEWPVTTGGSRNALLLHAGGASLLLVDDDTLCLVSPTPDALPGLAFSAQPDPTEIWFFAPEKLLPSGTAHDLLALHEQLLGVEAIFSKVDPAVAGGQPSVGRVRATSAGVLGDSGMGSPAYFLFLKGPSRERLLRSEESYRAALGCQPIFRATRRSTIGGAGVCMGYNLALDARVLLPPFLPVQRNSAGVFGALLQRCYGDHCFGHLPWAVLHQPPTPRRCTPEEFWQGLAGMGTGHVVRVLLSAGPAGGDPADATGNLRRLGSAFAEQGAARSPDFQEWVRSRLGLQLRGQAAEAEALLRWYGGQPEYWAADVRRALAIWRAAPANPEHGLPHDLVAAFGTGDGWPELRRLVGRFGRLLQEWPALVEAACELKNQGVRLAVSVTVGGRD